VVSLPLLRQSDFRSAESTKCRYAQVHCIAAIALINLDPPACDASEARGYWQQSFRSNTGTAQQTSIEHAQSSIRSQRLAGAGDPASAAVSETDGQQRGQWPAESRREKVGQEEEKCAIDRKRPDGDQKSGDRTVISRGRRQESEKQTGLHDDCDSCWRRMTGRKATETRA
jgi:hypothetical protein